MLFILLNFKCILLAQVNTEKLNPVIEKKIDSLIYIMTLDEKIGQMNQYTGDRVATGPIQPNSSKYNDIKEGRVGSMLNVRGSIDTRNVQAVAMQSRLKIPLIFGLDVIHGYRVTFPIPLAEAASWDLNAIQKSARTAAKEASAAGIHWTFAPMVDISRDPALGPRNGRSRRRSIFGIFNRQGKSEGISGEGTRQCRCSYGLRKTFCSVWCGHCWSGL